MSLELKLLSTSRCVWCSGNISGDEATKRINIGGKMGVAHARCPSA